MAISSIVLNARKEHGQTKKTKGAQGSTVHHEKHAESVRIKKKK